MDGGANPRDFKVRLAKEIVTMVHSEAMANKAYEDFERTFTKGEVPEDVPIIEIPNGSNIRDSLVKEGIVSSNADWKRLIDGNAVSYAGSDEVVDDPFIKAEDSITLRIGKKRFVKIVVK